MSAEAQWQQRATSPYSGGWDAAGFAIGNKVYVGTGWCCGAIPGSYQEDFRAYDVISNSWSTIAPFGGGIRGGAAAFSVAGKGYVFGGSNGTDQKDLWEYSTSSDTWVQRADMPTSFGRREAVAFSIGSVAYVGLGVYAQGIPSITMTLSDLWAYDPASNSWTQRAPLPSAGRGMAVAFVIETDAYVATGYGYSSTVPQEMWKYNSVANSWEQVASLPAELSRSEAVGFSINGFGYVSLGRQSGAALSDLWRYRPATDSWQQQTSFPGSPREAAVACSIGNKAYICHGGNLAGTVSYHDMWSYEPQQDPLNGIDEYEMRRLSIAPNPNDGHLTIKFARETDPRQLELLDASGRVVLSKLMSATRSSIDIDLSDWERGLYLMQVTFVDGNQAVERIIKD